MSGFERRIAMAADFEAELIELLKSHPNVLSLAKNGTEHTHPEFVAQLRSNESPAALFLRYAPDGVLLTKRNAVVHFDAKCGDTLEKNAYSVYSMLHKDGCSVLVFFRLPEGVFWQQASELIFRDSLEVVGRFSLDRQYPVDSDGWICPRSKPGFRSTERMSGTPYRYVDRACLRRW